MNCNYSFFCQNNDHLNIETLFESGNVIFEIIAFPNAIKSLRFGPKIRISGVTVNSHIYFFGLTICKGMSTLHNHLVPGLLLRRVKFWVCFYFRYQLSTFLLYNLKPYVFWRCKRTQVHATGSSMCSGIREMLFLTRFRRITSLVCKTGTHSKFDPNPWQVVQPHLAYLNTVGYLLLSKSSSIVHGQIDLSFTYPIWLLCSALFP